MPELILGNDVYRTLDLLANVNGGNNQNDGSLGILVCKRRKEGDKIQDVVYKIIKTGEIRDKCVLFSPKAIRELTGSYDSIQEMYIDFFSTRGDGPKMFEDWYKSLNKVRKRFDSHEYPQENFRFLVYDWCGGTLYTDKEGLCISKRLQDEPDLEQSSEVAAISSQWDFTSRD